MPNWYLGTSRVVPNVLLIEWPMSARPCWVRSARKHAPKTTPQTLPMPARITIERMKAEMLNEKSFGNVDCLKLAKYAPATPPKNAPVAYDHVFVRISGTPIAAAAVSSSRIAIHARPILESRRRALQNAVTTPSTSADQQKTASNFWAKSYRAGRCRMV